MKGKWWIGILAIIMAGAPLTVQATEDYTGYNGKWTDESLMVQPSGRYIHKALSLQIAADGLVKGEMVYRQVNYSKQDQKATARFEGKVRNNLAQCQFTDDWGYAGVVELTLGRHQVKARIKLIRSPKEQQAWGMFDDNVYYTKVNYTPLLQANETNVFSFTIPETGQTFTLAKGSGASDYLVCRLGTGKELDLGYPREVDDSWSNYRLSSLTRQEANGAKTELTYLRFGDESRIYTVYQEYQASTNQEFVGLRIEEPDKGIIIEQNGDTASVLGNLSILRFERRIRQSRL